MAIAALSTQTRHWLVIAAVALVVATGSWALVLRTPSTKAPDQSLRSQMTDGTPRASLKFGATTFRARIVADSAEVQHGLSGTRVLQSDDAMLFIFPRDDAWGIWMKDMFVPIDIVWLDATKTVVHIEKDVAPNTYPHVFTPSVPARYVVELPAGSAQKAGLGNGTLAEFDAPKEGE